MERSYERVQTLLNGRLPDRPPHFDLLRNDAVLSCLAGETLTLENADRVVYRAFDHGLDSTRPTVRLPQARRSVVMEDGRAKEHYRWTSWSPHPVVDDAYLQGIRKEIDANYCWSEQDSQRLLQYIQQHGHLRQAMPSVYLFWAGPHTGVGLHHLCHGMGVEQFSYLLMDEPDLVEAYLESSCVKTIQWVQRLAVQTHVPAYFVGEDIAFKSATLFSPDFLRRQYFKRLERLVTAMHEAGAKVMWHSDGNLMEVLDDLVATGIDVLNPIEVLAGMDVADIHRRHPKLIMAGGIDVSQLLPRGEPEQVRQAVRKAVADADGRIMVGSSTELHDEVPLANYLAMREAILGIEYGAGKSSAAQQLHGAKQS